ncbi:MAG: 3-deoxy-manno-octulosonate cytidylyltransferase [Flavobacteriaceae bacterium]|tara:strand:+ start:20702 stop:21433 length:732 start_codon:yes stop_codon:yes gene_type:complete
MNAIAMIPARFAATRFPAKLMQDLGGKPVILRTYEATKATNLFSEVYVVTDHVGIFDLIVNSGGKAIMSTQDYECGSDRIAAAATPIEADIIVNVQGDEPFIEANSLQALLAVFRADTAHKISLASLMYPISDLQEIQNPNAVKVVVNFQNHALYFSRAPIPFPRDLSGLQYFRHKGVYAFRKAALLAFPKMQMGPLEKAEKIEAIRYLEHGHQIKMIITSEAGIGIDVPEDLEKARAEWKFN